MRIFRRPIDPTKVSKYLLYASGELIIIIIGIYIAIQLDNWKEISKTREIEIKTLIEIKESLKDDSTDLHYNITKYKIVIFSCDSLIHLLETSKEIDTSEYKYFAGSLLTSYFLTNTAAYETLKSKGLEIISNDKLRNRLGHHYGGRHSYVKEIERELTEFILYVQNHVAIKHFDTVLPYNKKSDQSGLYYRMIPDNFQSLKADKEYIKCLKAIKAKTEYYIDQPARFTQRDIRDIIKMIESEVTPQ